MGAADGLEEVRRAISAGDPDAAVAIAERLAGAGQPRLALSAYFAIGEACPGVRARCAAAMGDLHASLGEADEAATRYRQAAEQGAPRDWVADRMARLAALPDDRVYISRGARDPGMWNQVGVVVLRPGRLAFIPTQAPTHVAGIAANAALGMAGVMRVRITRPQKPEVLVRELRRWPPRDLDAAIPTEVEQRGGVIWTAPEASYYVQKLPLGVRVSFVKEGDRILVNDAKLALRSPLFNALAATWPATG